MKQIDRLQSDVRLFHYMELSQMSLSPKPLNEISDREYRYQVRLWRYLVNDSNAGSPAQRVAQHYLNETLSACRCRCDRL